MTKLAVIRIRGQTITNYDLEPAFTLMGISKKNSCVIVEDSPTIKGSLRKMQHHITWGEISEDTIKELDEKRTRRNSKAYHLAPPRGGHGKKGIRRDYNIGGVLGYRGDKINDLIKRMI